MFARIFYSQLPHWARPDHPMMRYVLGARRLSRTGLLLRVLAILAIAGLLAGGYALARLAYEDLTYREYLYYPLIGTQLILQLLAIAITTNAVALERQKGTWESLQITTVGAANAIRTRWALVFYRLRWPLAALFILRLGYIGLLLNDMTDFEGRAIDVRIIGIAPEVTLEVAVFLLAALISAAIMQPFVNIAFDAALGIIVGSVMHRRNVGILSTVVLMGLRIAVTVGAVVLGSKIITADGTTAEILDMSTQEAWARTLFMTLQGDTALRLLHLETLGNLWADLQNGIYIGGVVLAGVVLTAILANAMVLFSAWRAHKPGKV